MSALPVLALLCGWLALAAPSARADDEAALSEARTLLRQGLLAQAEARLDTVPATAPLLPRAGAALLRGNIAYERGHYAAAEAAWTEAAALYDDAAGAGPSDREPATTGAAAARENRALAHEQLERAGRLQASADGLRHATLAALLLGGAVVALLARRSGRAARVRG